MTDLTILPVAVDAMGADFGPTPVVEGAVQAAQELGLSSVVVGKEEDLKSLLVKFGVNPGSALAAKVTVAHAPDVITMDDSPTAAIRGKPQSSIRIAYELVNEGKASAVVSPGNTGGMMAAGMYVSGTLPGIARPAIASLIPKVGNASPTVLLDSGANVDCNANQLVQFAIMGSCYAKFILGVENPRIALLSNGSEPSKGTDIIRSASQLLAALPQLNYIGYVEGRDMGRDVVDVVVCDGFVGNVLLKAMEGSVTLVFDSIKHYVEKSFRAKIGMYLARPMFKALFKEKLDPSAYGGAPLLGLNHVGIVCHGSSNARAIKNAIKGAEKFVSQNLVSNMASALEAAEASVPSDFQDGVWKLASRFEKKKK